MAQPLARDEQGNIWDISDPTRPRFVSRAPLASPTLPGQLQAQQDTHAKTALDIQKTAGTLAADEQTAKAQAKSAEIKAAQDQEQWNITHPSANGTEGLSGPAYMHYLQQTDPGRAAYVQGLAEGRVPFPNSNMMRTPAGQALLAQVMRADPTIDATNYSTRAAARVNAAKGTLGQSDNALVTAIGHAARLEGLVPNVFGTKVTPVNSIANAVDSNLFGGKQPAYDQNAQLLGDEVAAAYGTNSQGKQNEAGAQFSSSLSAKQKQDNILGAIDLMASKLAANRAQFAYGNGQLGKPDFMLLPPQVQQQMHAIPGADKIFAKYFAGVPVMGGDTTPPPPPGTPPMGPQGPHLGPQPPSGPQSLAMMDPNSPLGVFKQTYRNVPDPQNAKTYQYENHPLPGLHGDSNPLAVLPGGPGSPPPGAPPVQPQGPTPPDLSNMIGGPSAGLATGGVKNVYDPVMASTLATFIKKGVPYDTAAQFAQSHGFNAPDPNAYSAAVAFAQQHGGATNVQANRQVATTMGERLAASPLAAGITAAGSAGTAGLLDTGIRSLVGPGYDANRAALAATNPTADLLGNIAGGAAGMFGAGQVADALGIAAKARQVLGAARAAKLGQFAPFATDLGYGTTYGASEDPNNPLHGALTGAVTAGIGGAAARGLVRSVGSAIAPTGGNLASIFDANPDFRPTIGQRLSASDSRFARALGMGEQAAESMPAVGGIQTGARSAATDQMQRGAYNMALGDLAPFSPILGRDVSQLPPGINKGAEANDFLHKAMSDAQQLARSGMRFAPDQQYAQEFGAWQRNPDALSLTTDQRSHVQDAIKQALGGRIGADGTMAGQDYGAAASDLARVARNWSGNPATSSQASYLRDFLSIMDGAASRASPPEASALLDAANRGYAKSVIIENAAKAAGGEPTEFTGKQLLKSVQNSDPSVRDRMFLSGKALMQDYATAASKLSPSLADSGTPQRLAWMKGAGAVEGIGLGAAAHLGGLGLLPVSAYGLDTFANLPGVRNAVGAAMAPRSAILPPPLADATNLVGQGLYNRANGLGMFGAPLALSYLGGQ